jgi:3-hydroxybutyryl-CoA dehydratase
MEDDMKYEEIEIGQTAKYTKWITPSIIDDFIAICGDNNPIHVKGEKPIVHGMLICSFISTLIGKQLPGDGALWKSFDVKFIQTIHVWDKIVIIGQVHSKNDRIKSIKLLIDVFNENDDLCVAATAIVKCTE